MLKGKLLCFAILLTLSLTMKPIYSWDSEAAKFYPLAVGNSWSYNHKIYSPPLGCGSVTSQYNYIVSIVSDTLRNGHRYFKFSDGRLVRIDSSTMNVYRYNGFSECKTDSLLARKNNYIYNTCNSGPYPLGDTSLIFFAGQNRRTKTMYLIGGQRTLMYDIGVYLDGICELGTGSVDILNGAIINGVQYGQMLGVNQISSEVPSSFSLSQNYPNPFNPVTKIRFTFPADGKGQMADVKLIVYDVLGREVTTLLPAYGSQAGVNESATGGLKPGTYEVEFDGTNYVSGVYFYKLSVSASTSLSTTYSETKKMLIIK